MIITKRTIPPAERIWIGKCRECQSEATAKRSELTHVVDSDQRNPAFSWEKCPVCGAGTEGTGYGGMLFHQDPDQDKPQ